MRIFLRCPQTDLYTLLPARKCAASFAKQEVYQKITGAVFSALYHAFQQSQCVLYRIKTPPTSSSLCSLHIQNRGWSVYVVLEMCCVVEFMCLKHECCIFYGTHFAQVVNSVLNKKSVRYWRINIGFCIRFLLCYNGRKFPFPLPFLENSTKKRAAALSSYCSFPSPLIQRIRYRVCLRRYPCPSCACGLQPPEQSVRHRRPLPAQRYLARIQCRSSCFR